MPSMIKDKRKFIVTLFSLTILALSEILFKLDANAIMAITFISGGYLGLQAMIDKNKKPEA